MKKNVFFLFSFFIAKGITFLAPILLADILTKNDFGMLEYALAGVGMLLNSIISLGVPGAYPYFICWGDPLGFQQQLNMIFP